MGEGRPNRREPQEDQGRSSAELVSPGKTARFRRFSLIAPPFTDRLLASSVLPVRIHRATEFLRHFEIHRSPPPKRAMERIRAIRLLSYRSALLRSTPLARKARKRANLIDFLGESRHPRLAGGAGWIRTIGSACLARERPIFSIFLSPRGGSAFALGSSSTPPQPRHSGRGFW